MYMIAIGYVYVHICNVVNSCTVYLPFLHSYQNRNIRIETDGSTKDLVNDYDSRTSAILQRLV